MKLCYFNDWRLGVIKGDQVVDVTDAAKGVPHRDTRDLIVGVIADIAAVFAAVAICAYIAAHVS